jgi:hypothetical protein
MIRYDALNELLSSDLSQLRAENGHGTLIAITQFVNGIVEFFEQFERFSKHGKVIPTPQEIKNINQQIKQLFSKLSTVEKEYYSKKYMQDPDYAEFPADQLTRLIAANGISSMTTLRKRMQYWAATDKFGETIRNPKQHQAAVNALDKWDSLFFSKKENTLSFFDSRNKTEVPTLNLSRKTKYIKLESNFN